MEKMLNCPSDKGYGKDRCPIRELLSRLGDKWSMLVIIALAEAPESRLRFSELLRQVDGISQRMLTTTLRQLERDGILTRELFPAVPPRVEYTLSALGKDLLCPVKSLVDWTHKHWPDIEKSRHNYDQRDAAASSI